MAAVYYIDAVAVNSRNDWRHREVTTPMPRAVDGFPGFSRRYVRKGALKPPRIVVTGFLTGNDFDALWDNVASARALMDSLSVHSVRMHDNTWANCDLVNLDVLGNPDALGNDLAVRVRYLWEQLSF